MFTFLNEPLELELQLAHQLQLFLAMSILALVEAQYVLSDLRRLAVQLGLEREQLLVQIGQLLSAAPPDRGQRTGRNNSCGRRGRTAFVVTGNALASCHQTRRTQLQLRLVTWLSLLGQCPLIEKQKVLNRLQAGTVSDRCSRHDARHV